MRVPTLACAALVQFSCAKAVPPASVNTSSVARQVASSRSTPDVYPDPYIKVVAGLDFTCALRASGLVECFGKNDHGQSSPPPGRFSTISTAGDRSGVCGVLTSGALQCWGDWSPQPLPPGEMTDVCFEDHDGCAIHKSDRHVECWGNRSADPPSNFVASSLSCNAPGRCALSDTGQLECWTTGQATPTQRREAFSAVSVGVQYACGILYSDRSLMCWGNNGAEPKPKPTRGTRYTALSGGTFLFCAVTNTYRLECFAAPALDAAYTLNKQDILPPPELSHAPVRDVSCGWNHSCAILTTGEIACWGNRAFGMAPRRRNP